MSTDTIDDVMAKAVGVPVAYEVPWYRTVPLKTFIQLVCLKLRGAPWHICLRSCVIGKTIAMVCHGSLLYCSVMFALASACAYVGARNFHHVHVLQTAQPDLVDWIQPDCQESDGFFQSF